MIKVENNETNRIVQQAVANMALSGMYFDEDFIRMLIDMIAGNIDVDTVIKSIENKYAKQEKSDFGK